MISKRHREVSLGANSREVAKEFSEGKAKVKQIVWTRPAEDWETDKKFMRSTNHVMLFPLTRQVEICPKLPSTPCDHVIVTSKKAATAFVQKCQLSKEALHKPEYITFGLETYKYLLGLNFRARLIEAQSARKFAENLVSEIKKTAAIWFPRPVDVAFEVSDYLRSQGVAVYDINMYKTEPVKTIEPALIQKLTADPCIVCLASPSAVKSFVDIVLTHDNGKFHKYTPVVIGPTTKAAAQSYFKEVLVSSHTTLQSLWEKAYETARKDDIRSYLSVH
ncbi:MAG: uroporphyrinogen-III synthase [Proteobacteria bacterium]|nr:MAG: uroporphyrinogen-III synthase [Pseudomonadota bacterium]